MSRVHETFDMARAAIWTEQILTLRSTVMHPEPLDLTEGQWDVVFRNNRALHGWNYKDGVMVKARKRGT